MTESAYADGAAFLFPSIEISERNTPRIMKHCAELGMEVHSGITETPDAKGKTSKTELRFVEKPSHTKLTNLSPIILEGGDWCHRRCMVRCKSCLVLLRKATPFLIFCLLCLGFR